jgi:prepilin-type N-terminal cleavage/methylation domain-containing protein
VKTRGGRGFTLLELSVVLAIIALVTGMAITSGISVVETARLTATQKKMKAIDDALMQYRSANDRLPCPGDLTITQGSANFGIEAANPGTCTGGTPAANFTGPGATNPGTAAEGALPAVSLGLSPDFMVDGWGNRFRYAVDVSMTAYSAFPLVNVGCTAGAITVNDVNGNARSTGSIYALISHGANGHGAYTSNGVVFNAGSVNTNELANCHCNSSGVATSYAPTYVQMQQIADPSNALDNFDDLVSYKERWQMQTNWDKTGGCAYVYVVDELNDRVQKFNTNGVYLSQYDTSCHSASYPEDIVFTADGNYFYVTEGNNQRVEKFAVNGNGQCLSSGGYSSLGGAGSGNGQFSGPGPYGIAIDASGNFYITDPPNNRVEKFDSNFNYLSQIGCASGQCTAGSGNGQLHWPTAITIDASGNIWVADTLNYRVQEFNSSGSYVNQVGSTSTTYYPDGVAIDASGNVWVSDPQNGQVGVAEFNSSGSYLGRFGSPGSGNGQFSGNWGIAFDPSGNMYVVDSGNNRVQKFNSSGTYISQFGTSGSGNGQFNTPLYIAISR